MKTLRYSFGFVLSLLTIVGIIILAVQPVRTMMQDSFQGILYKGGDESQYIMRVTQAFDHPFSDVSNAITSGTRGLQMTFLESAVGTLFGWTGLSGPMLTILVACLIAALIIPFFAFLTLRFGVQRHYALLGGVVIFFLLIGPLRRVVHQSWSLPLVVFTLLLIVDWWKNSTRLRSVLLGVVLGIMPGVYVWAWTYTWAVFGFVFFLTIITDIHNGRRQMAYVHVRKAVITGAIALLCALPFFLLMWSNAAHPDAAETSIRSSLIHAREWESIPRSIILILFAACSVFALRRQPERHQFLPLIAMILALVAVLHQQFVHGLVLSFWTHYYPYVCAISLLTVLVIFSSRERSYFGWLSLLMASVLLLGAFHDYKGRFTIFASMPRWEKYQHLAPAISALNQIHEKQTVLSDLDSSLIIGTYSHHDLLYTEYLRHVLMSTPELAERYCLTQFITGKPADTDWLAYNIQELSAAGQKATLEKVERDKKLTKEACDLVYAHPAEVLEKYGVTLMLWDEKNYPDWKIPATYFVVSERGSGWSLWSVR